ncbi:MAG: L,D-transpeptidase [Bdellovibrionota bacterium]
MGWRFLIVLLCAFVMSTSAQAARQIAAPDESGAAELNPFAPGVEEMLRKMDEYYESETGQSAFPAGREEDVGAAGCYRAECAIFVDIDKASQTLRLYVDGRLESQMLVSTGRPGYSTPDFDKRFSGRIYDKFTSGKYPGGDYMGLGNMPYAMFISGGFALHGTPEVNWPMLGRTDSHGCIRILPENAKYINRLLRQKGVRNSWIWVH